MYVYVIISGRAVLFLQNYELRVGALPYETIYDRNLEVNSTNQKDLSKKYRLFEGHMINIICEVPSLIYNKKHT